MNLVNKYVPSTNDIVFFPTTNHQKMFDYDEKHNPVTKPIVRWGIVDYVDNYGYIHIQEYSFGGKPTVDGVPLDEWLKNGGDEWHKIPTKFKKDRLEYAREQCSKRYKTFQYPNELLDMLKSMQMSDKDFKENVRKLIDSGDLVKRCDAECYVDIDINQNNEYCLKYSLRRNNYAKDRK